MAIQAELYYWKDCNLGLGHVALRVFDPDIPWHEGQYISWAQGNNYEMDRTYNNKTFPDKVLLPRLDDQNYDNFVSKFEQSIYTFPRYNYGKHYALLSKNCADCALEMAILAGYQFDNVNIKKTLPSTPHQVQEIFARYQKAIVKDGKHYKTRLKLAQSNLNDLNKLQVYNPNINIDGLREHYLIKILAYRDLLIDWLGIAYRHAIKKPNEVVKIAYALSYITEDRLQNDIGAIRDVLSKIPLYSGFSETVNMALLSLKGTCRNLQHIITQCDEEKHKDVQYSDAPHGVQHIDAEPIDKLLYKAPKNIQLIQLLSGGLQNNSPIHIQLFIYYITKGFNPINIDIIKDNNVIALHNVLCAYGINVLFDDKQAIYGHIRHTMGTRINPNKADVSAIRVTLAKKPEYIQNLMEKIYAQYNGLLNIASGEHEELFTGLQEWHADIQKLYESRKETLARLQQEHFIDFIKVLAPLFQNQKYIPPQEIEKQVSRALGNLQLAKLRAGYHHTTPWYGKILIALAAIALLPISVVIAATLKHKTGSSILWTPQYRCRKNLHSLSKEVKKLDITAKQTSQDDANQDDRQDDLEQMPLLSPRRHSLAV